MSDNLIPLTRSPEAPVARGAIDGNAVTVRQRPARQWLPTIAWAVRRTGRRGLIGIALVASGLVFALSTHLPLVNEVETLRGDLQASKAASARHAVQAAAATADDPRRLLDSLPIRTEVPRLLGVILAQADGAGLSLDSGKYDISSQHTGGVTRYNVSFPVSGPYPAVRSFIDEVLKAVPTAAISELSIERKSIADGIVEANVRLTLYTRGAP